MPVSVIVVCRPYICVYDSHCLSMHYGCMYVISLLASVCPFVRVARPGTFESIALQLVVYIC